MNPDHEAQIDRVAACGEIPTIINGEVMPAMNDRAYQAKLAIAKAASELGREIDQFPDRSFYRTGDVVWGVRGEWVAEITLRRK